MFLYEVTLFTCILIAFTRVQGADIEHRQHSNNDWDILMFSQHWPVTVCYQWQEKSLKNKCSFPILKDIWTVHGIWPTKIGTEGPNFCNSSWKFDPSQLYPLQKQLEIYWINIEKNTPLYSFWKHEWKKHGTCSTSLSELDSESKFFKQALTWIDKYDMSTVLAKSGITPNATTGYHPEEIYDAITSVLEKNPTLECIYDKKKGKSYISEIRICFDKNMELVDCNGVKDSSRKIGKKIISNCDPSIPIMYLNTVPNPPTPPPTVATPSSKKDMDIYWWIDVYRFLNLLRWFTL